jgi:hypothetical protein
MPEWIHNRAEHLLAKNPNMKKETAFAVATQQSHALGKSPKGYGTAEGKREAKAKYDTPKDDKKTANPGQLDSPKLASWKDTLPGGLADKKKPGDFDLKSIRQGRKVESEHTGDKHTQTEISMDHLTEDPHYYEKLKKMEKSSMPIEYGAFFDELEMLASNGTLGPLVKQAASGLERAAELGGLGILAVPQIDTMIARHRATKAGISNPTSHDIEKRRLIKEKWHAPVDVAGLATLAAPYLRKHGGVVKNLIEGAGDLAEGGKKLLMTDIPGTKPWLLGPAQDVSRGMSRMGSKPPVKAVSKVRSPKMSGGNVYDVSRQAREMGL